MIIKTYNPETLQEQETISKITSVIWNRRFYKTGSFEIQTNSDVFKTNDIIAFCDNGEIRSGIVMRTKETTGGVNVSGYDLKGIFGFRYMNAIKTYRGTPGEIIKDIAEEYLNTEERKIPGLIIYNNTAGTSTMFSNENKFLDENLEKFCMANETGISVDFDLKNIILSIQKGVDRSGYIKFGRKTKSISGIEYTNDLFNAYNVGYSADDEGNETVTGNSSGFMRRECHNDKNINEYLAEKSAIETLRAVANEKYKYGSDYNLGDYVLVQTSNGETVKQITEIKEVYEKNTKSIIPIFGTEKENPIKKILKGV